jgi:hypothetical protein
MQINRMIAYMMRMEMGITMTVVMSSSLSEILILSWEQFNLTLVKDTALVK